MDERPQPPLLGAEDEARAQWYALISRLFYAPPDAALLRGLAAAPAGTDDESGDTRFLDAWRGFQAACADADPEAVRAEFDDLFVGVGRSPVTPYTSAYAAAHAPDRHLLALRAQLAAWGLARRDRVFETEDHVSAVCDTMRWLIEQGYALEAQCEFFLTFVAPALPSFCNAINTSPMASFYRSAETLVSAFFEVEKDAFDMHADG